MDGEIDFAKATFTFLQQHLYYMKSANNIYLYLFSVVLTFAKEPIATGIDILS